MDDRRTEVLETPSAPRRFLDSALRAVKGDNTQKLVEDFTSEMTLVAEGLADDQARLNRELEGLKREQDRGAQKLAASLDALETEWKESRRDADSRLEELTRRADALENRLEKLEKKQGKGPGVRGILSQVTILAAIVVGGWVLVTVLNLIR